MINAVHRVSFSQDPRVAEYRSRRRIITKHGERLFLAEGAKIVERLLTSACRVRSIFLDDSWFDRLRVAIEDRSEPIDVFLGDKQLVEAVTGYSCFQPVKAVAFSPLPGAFAQDWSAVPDGHGPRLIAAIDGIGNAENIGALIRNLAAFGGDALVWSATSCTPWLSRVIRTSMGTIFQIPIIESPRLSVTLSDLRSRGIRCVAAHARPGEVEHRLSDTRLDRDCCIVFGHEDRGISDEVLAECDECVTIPMAAGVDSLNVATAAGICFYEASHQRGRV